MTQNQYDKFMTLAGWLIQNYPISPSYREIKDMWGIKSVAAIRIVLALYVKMGFIDAPKFQARAITLTKKGKELYQWERSHSD